jgi:hypothetical protein
VGMVVIGHWKLNYLGSLHLPLPLYLWLSQGHITFGTSSDKGEDKWSWKDKRGISPHYWGRCGMPRDQFKPNPDNPFSTETPLSRHIYSVEPNTYWIGALQIQWRATHVKPIRPKRNSTPKAKEMYL